MDYRNKTGNYSLRRTRTFFSTTLPPPSTTAPTKPVTRRFKCTTTAPTETHSVTTAIIVLILITVLLLAIIIFFICRRIFGKEIIPKCLLLRESSKPQTDVDGGYVEPNSVPQVSAGRQVLMRQKRAEENSNKAMVENKHMGTENEPHAYIYLEGNNGKAKPPERVPEVIYHDSPDPDKVPNAQTKVDPIYNTIDSATADGPQSYGRPGDLDSNTTNEYHVLELNNRDGNG